MAKTAYKRFVNGMITVRNDVDTRTQNVYDCPIGVSLFKRTGKYYAQCNNPFTEKNENLGYFSTPEDAHEAWRKRKHELAQLVAATEADSRIVEALKRRYSPDEWY